MTKIAGVTVPTSAARIVWLVFGILLLLYVLYALQGIIALVLFSLVLASALYPPVKWLEKRHKMPRKAGILIFYLTFVVVAGTVLFLAGSALIEQGQQFMTQLPQYVDRIKDWVKHLPEPLASMSIGTSEQINELAQRGFTVLVSTLDYLRTFFAGILGLLTVLVLTFYLLIDLKHFEHLVLLMLPDSRKEVAHSVLARAALKTGGYVRGQLLLMVIMGIIIGGALALLGIKYAFLLGVIAFALDVIPLVGPTIAACIGTLVTFAQEPSLAPWVLLLYFGSQQFENYVLVPRVMSAAVELKPFWILLALLAGASLGGVVGTLLAIPTAVMLHLLIDEFYIRGVLGKDPRMTETLHHKLVKPEE